MFCEWKYSAKFEFMYINFLLMDHKKKIHQKGSLWCIAKTRNVSNYDVHEA